MDIKKVLEKHALWLNGDKGGERANLSRADLSGADLSRADLSRANLSYANLRYACLSRADLSRANLSYADLRYADLRYADLSGAEGIILLPVQDMRGYSFAHAIVTKRGWRIRAGCRDFSIAQAKENWGDGYEGDREQGDMYLYAIDWLEKKLAQQGGQE